MSGQRDFTFSPATVKRLREYLDNCGARWVYDVIGSSEFDRAFRREIAKVYPDKPLKPLPDNHPLYKYVNDVSRVHLAPLAEKELGGGVTAPLLEAIQVDGSLPVIYSPISMSAGWEQLPRAFNKGYADDDALKLGVNVFMYETAH